MLGREPYRSEGILDLVGDHARHFRPGLQTLPTQHFGYVFYDEQGRGLARTGKGRPNQGPFVALFGIAVFQLNRLLRQSVSNTRQPARDRLQSRVRTERRLDRASHLARQQFHGHSICRQHSPVPVQGDHTCRDVVDHHLDDVLLPENLSTALGNPLGHAVDRFDKSGQFQLGRLQTE